MEICTLLLETREPWQNEIYKRVHAADSYGRNNTIIFLDQGPESYSRKLPPSWLQGQVDLSSQDRVVRPAKKLKQSQEGQAGRVMRKAAPMKEISGVNN